MRRFAKTLLFAAAIWAVFFCPAQAASQLLLIRCEPRDAWMRIVGQFNEVRVAAGTNDRGLVEVFANRETGSFTVIVTDVHGTSFGIVAGEDFEAMDPRGDAT